MEPHRGGASGGGPHWGRSSNGAVPQGWPTLRVEPCGGPVPPGGGPGLVGQPQGVPTEGVEPRAVRGGGPTLRAEPRGAVPQKGWSHAEVGGASGRGGALQGRSHTGARPQRAVHEAEAEPWNRWNVKGVAGAGCRPTGRTWTGPRGQSEHVGGSDQSHSMSTVGTCGQSPPGKAQSGPVNCNRLRTMEVM